MPWLVRGSAAVCRAACDVARTQLHRRCEGPSPIRLPASKPHAVLHESDGQWWGTTLRPASPGTGPERGPGSGTQASSAPARAEYAAGRWIHAGKTCWAGRGRARCHSTTNPGKHRPSYRPGRTSVPFRPRLRLTLCPASLRLFPRSCRRPTAASVLWPSAPCTGLPSVRPSCA
jgi:hypothetical protein